MNKYVISNKEEVSSELVIKKSRFIAKAYYVTNVDDINSIINENKNKYYDARHVVYAYRLESTSKFTDDKEPQGTAGKPIYNILEKENLINILVIVIRYFGGILLGAGPLTRAYSKVANDVIKQCEKKKYIKYIEKQIVCEYKEEEYVKKNLINKKCEIKQINHLDKVIINYLQPDI